MWMSIFTNSPRGLETVLQACCFYHTLNTLSIQYILWNHITFSGVEEICTPGLPLRLAWFPAETSLLPRLLSAFFLQESLRITAPRALKGDCPQWTSQANKHSGYKYLSFFKPRKDAGIIVYVRKNDNSVRTVQKNRKVSNWTTTKRSKMINFMKAKM